VPLSTSGPQDCAVKGAALLNTAYFNKGAGFTAEERREFDLTGLLPQHVATLETQVKRAYQQYCTRPDDLAKNTFMTSMKEQNEVLYYRVRFFLLSDLHLCGPVYRSSGNETILAKLKWQLIQDHLKEMFSIIYTPTEGDAIQNFSKLFRRPEGCFLNINDPDRVCHDLAQWGNSDDIDYIVVTGKTFRMIFYVSQLADKCRRRGNSRYVKAVR
jgi:malate dehydrogenase (oxaloacetate-decarboxylating)